MTKPKDSCRWRGKFRLHSEIRLLDAFEGPRSRASEVDEGRSLLAIKLPSKAKTEVGRKERSLPCDPMVDLSYGSYRGIYLIYQRTEYAW